MDLGCVLIKLALQEFRFMRIITDKDNVHTSQINAPIQKP
jgi:hypothetical protein